MFGTRISRRGFCALLASPALRPDIPPHRLSLDPADRIPLTDSEKEEFLRTARIIKTKEMGIGITRTVRATLTDGRITHDASIQTIEVYQTVYRTVKGVEFGFKDSYKFNLAAYRLAALLGIEAVPPSVGRSYNRRSGSYTWWVEDVMMDSAEQKAKGIDPPDWEDWNQQMYTVRLFDQLIDNTDRNQGNLLITKDWKVWMIDHTRAFRKSTTLRVAAGLIRCERQLFERLKALTPAILEHRFSDCLSKSERKCLLTRRDLVLARLEQLGEKALFDPKRTSTVNAVEKH